MALIPPPQHVSALTKTYVGYRGHSAMYPRTSFYSDRAAPIVATLFESFDDEATEAFLETLRNDDTLRERIRYPGQLKRLRKLGKVLLDRPGLDAEPRKLLELLVDETKTEGLFKAIKLKSAA